MGAHRSEDITQDWMVSFTQANTQNDDVVTDYDDMTRLLTIQNDEPSGSDSNIVPRLSTDDRVSHTRSMVNITKEVIQK